MRVSGSYGLVVAVVSLAAPPAIAQLVSPVHESNIELCRQVWERRPEQEKRCLIARRDLVETLARNPYAHPPEEKIAHGCGNHGRSCVDTTLEDARQLSFYYNYLHSAVADAVMWEDGHQFNQASKHLERLLWCDSKYRPGPDSTNYYDVLECASFLVPSNSNPFSFTFGPSGSRAR